MKHAISNACLAAALTLLLGQFTDKTTGQPLHGVHVDLTGGRAARHAVTGSDGRFRLSGLKPGRYTLNYSSADVPPRTLSITLRGVKTQLHVSACSTTLDYSCVGPGGGM